MKNNTVFEEGRSIEVRHSCEVLVAGGGIAGIAAAIAAARNGKDVILLEREYALGGMATLGLITIYLPLDDGEGNQVVFGLGEELLKLSILHGAEAKYPKAWLEGGTLAEKIENRYVVQYNPHLFALEAERLMVKLGVRILYGTLACGIAKEGDWISEVFIENKSGRAAIRADSYIDCTGDADLCSMSGAKTVLHSRGNALASWYYYYTEGNVKLKMFGLADVKPDEDTSIGGAGGPAQVDKIASGRFSGVDGEELSRAVLDAHEKMYRDIMESRASAEDLLPVTIPSIPLIRMSRRLEGKYVMSDTENRVYTEDSIGMTGDWRKRGPAYELPYRVLYCDEITNLLAAGRCISVDEGMWDITRVIPPCAVTGEAAGTAASLTDNFKALDVKELQDRLKSRGVKLHL
ncbi:MAG: FAD-dependent oxidoreductase [Clostridiales Family XIII bacterium]|nr:FAD-dependent oxidoreductase [Clostridiales Family XIII bacterium]